MICSSEFLAGHGSNRFSFANKEALRIGGVKAVRHEDRDSALRRGPFEGEREIGLRHLAHNEIVAHGSLLPQVRFAAATSPSVT